MPDTWHEISRRFHDGMGNESFSPAFHSYTEGIFRDATLPLKERYIAWILRMTWGNSSEFCCQRTRTLDREPLLQIDAARALGVARNTISIMTRRFVNAGRINVDGEGRIVLNKRRGHNVTAKKDPDKAWAAVESRWRADFPQRAARLDEIRAQIEPLQAEREKIRAEQLRYFKHVTRSGDDASAPVTGDLFRSGDNSVSRSGDKMSPAPVTPEVSPNIGTRATSNSKQETTLVSECIERLEAADQEHSLTEIRQAVEKAYGAALQEGDAIPTDLLTIARRLTVPVQCLIFWIYAFAKKKREARYEITSPRLFVKAADKDLLPWAGANADAVATYQREEEIPRRERQAAAEYLTDPTAPDDEKQWARQVLGIADAKGTAP